MGVRGFGHLKAAEYQRGDELSTDDPVTEGRLGEGYHIARSGAYRPGRSPDRNVVEKRLAGSDQDGEWFDVSGAAIDYLHKRHLLMPQHRLGDGVAAVAPPLIVTEGGVV